MPATPDIAPETLEKMRNVFETYQELAAVVLFGSRVTGKSTPRSDFDLATHGIGEDYRLGRLALDLEDLNIPQSCDVKAYESIRYLPLKRHIDLFGVTIYRRPD